MWARVLVCAAVAAATLEVTSADRNGNSTNCLETCNYLKTTLGTHQIYSVARPNFYWAEQIQDIQPACFVEPQGKQDVSLIVQRAVIDHCPFAIKGGGHSGVPGANNLAGGLVIELSRFLEIEVSRDGNIVRVGAGNTWGNVYRETDRHGIFVVGGRNEKVGVPGLVLGGGISYFSGKHGFACDNVHSFEVVLADGRIVTAGADNAYSDLYRALRGGGNNFGIVTHFNLIARPYNLMHRANRVFRDSPAVAAAQVRGLVEYAQAAPSDPNAHMYIALGIPADGKAVWISSLFYDQAYDVRERPAIFKPYYTPLLNASLIRATEQNDNHSTLAAALGKSQPVGQRNQFYTTTFRLNRNLTTTAFDIFRWESAALNMELRTRGRQNISTVLAMQPITSNVLSHGSGVNGNVMGLAPDEAPFVVVSMAWAWDDSTDDRLILGGMQRVIDGIDREATKCRLQNDWIYMNYAQAGAQVIAGYGKPNQDFLRRVSRTYDPKGVFQRLVPGGFKLW